MGGGTRARKLQALFQSHLPTVSADDVEILIEVFTSAIEDDDDVDGFDAETLATSILDLCLEVEDPDTIAVDLAEELNAKFSLNAGESAAVFSAGDSAWAVLEEDAEYHEVTVLGAGDTAETVRVLFEKFGVERTLDADQVVSAEDGGGDGDTGLCEMCRRDAVLTIHHMIPRSEHTRYLHKGYSHAFLKGITNQGVSEEATNIAMICRPCHNMVHRVATNKVLAETMHTVELILEHPNIATWVKYAAGRVHLTGH